MDRKKLAPLSLTCVRLVLAPVMIAVALFVPDSGGWLVAALLVGLVSDIFDGIVARRLGVSSPGLRRFDSQTDLVFWLATAACVWITHPQLVRDRGVEIGVLLFMEVMCYVVSWARFGRETCTHAFLSKIWGLMLLFAFGEALWSGTAGIVFEVMFIWGLVAHVDVILITLLLPKWEHDVPSAYHAWRIRRGMPIKRHMLLNGVAAPVSGAGGR